MKFSYWAASVIFVAKSDEIERIGGDYVKSVPYHSASNSLTVGVVRCRHSKPFEEVDYQYNKHKHIMVSVTI